MKTMFRQLKHKLLQSPEIIVNILEFYGFSNPKIHSKEIRCGLYNGGNQSAIRICLTNNDNLFVTDYVRGVSYDLIN